MIRDESILKWIETARWAPSADNCQPWIIDWEVFPPDEVRLNISMRHQTHIPDSIYEAMDFVALGSFGFSLICAAKSDGFHPKSIESAGRGFCLRLQKLNSNTGANGWTDLIQKRRTCRLPYEKVPLSPDDRARLEQVAGKYRNIHCLEFRSNRSKAAELLSKLDLIRYQNDIHLDRLLKILRFGDEGQIHGDGLDVKALEIPWAAALFFRLLRRFPVLKWIFFTSLVRIFTHLGCRLLVENSSELFHLSADENTPRSWFDLGQCLQEIWLEATGRNLALQPLGHTFIPIDVRLSPNHYSRRHQDLVHAVQKELLALGADFYKPGLLFRIGYSHNRGGVKSERYGVDRLVFRFSK